MFCPACAEREFSESQEPLERADCLTAARQLGGRKPNRLSMSQAKPFFGLGKRFICDRRAGSAHRVPSSERIDERPTIPAVVHEKPYRDACDGFGSSALARRQQRRRPHH